MKKRFVGQPIFKQLVDFIPKGKFDLLAQKHQTDRYYKAFPALDTAYFDGSSGCLAVAILWGKSAMGMLGMQGKLNHLGLERSPAKSTAGDGLRERGQRIL